MQAQTAQAVSSTAVKYACYAVSGMALIRPQYTYDEHTSKGAAPRASAVYLSFHSPPPPHLKQLLQLLLTIMLCLVLPTEGVQGQGALAPAPHSKTQQRPAPVAGSGTTADVSSRCPCRTTAAPVFPNALCHVTGHNISFSFCAASRAKSRGRFASCGWPEASVSATHCLRGNCTCCVVYPLEQLQADQRAVSAHLATLLHLYGSQLNQRLHLHMVRRKFRAVLAAQRLS